MKTGIITLHNPPNYGAMLQAHGLSSCIYGLGHDVEIVDFHQPQVEEYYKFKLSFPPRFNHWLRLKRSRDFVSKRQRLSSSFYRSVDEFQQRANDYEALICGSDQIWYTGPVHYYEPMYFLDIPGFMGRRISYAASVGGANDFGEFKDKAANAIEKIDYRSVRDSHSESTVKGVADVPIERVMDPVFLHDFEDLLEADSPEPQPYLLVFGNFPSKHDKSLRALAKKKGLDYIVTLQYPNSAANKRLPAPTPEQWLNYFKHASCVLTSYFHGTVVSIKFERDFVSVPTPGRRSKVKTLLESVGCGARYLEAIDSDEDLATTASNSIDWSETARKRNNRIEHSIEFLQRALSI